MLSNTEFGAPWNNQFYVVTYEIDGDILTEIMTLCGPYKYSYDDLVQNVYMNFGLVNIINIRSCYEVCR